MKKRIKIDWARHAPPGLSLRNQKEFFIAGAICATLFSLGFPLRLNNAYHNLFDRTLRGPKLRPDAVMPDFIDMLADAQALHGFVMLAVCMLAFIVYHYAYHHQGGKSIYLMRRLPSRWELHRRCLTLPLCAAAACLAFAAVLFLLYFAIYMAVTPAECLSPHQWQKIWSVIL